MTARHFLAPLAAHIITLHRHLLHYYNGESGDRSGYLHSRYLGRSYRRRSFCLLEEWLFLTLFTLSNVYLERGFLKFYPERVLNLIEEPLE
jgi:hypothetical protein